jgi:hypothetical protein
MTIEAYPLTWPAGRPRTPEHQRTWSKFDTTMARARDEVVRQIELMGGRYAWMRKETNLIISTNVKLRQDGIPLANQIRNIDSGVAVYFNYKKRAMCFACDRWAKVEDNMWAIAKTIDALRGIARWGTGDMMEAAFTGFTALPAPGADTAVGWRTVLGFTEGERPNVETVEHRYKRRAAEMHPDRPGGSHEAMLRLNEARDQAYRELA